MHAAQPSAVAHDRPPADGLRERKKRTTRNALRLAALSLVAERGLDGVTTDEIAAAVDVSPRTFFNYFSGKEDALVGTDPEMVTVLCQELAQRPAGESPLEAMREVFVRYADTISVDQRMWPLRLKVIEDNPSLLPALLGASAGIERALTDAVAERTGTDPARDTYPSLVATVAAAATRTALQHCGSGQGTRPFPEVVTEVFDSLLAGLPVPPQH